jgi:methylated-DNA-protein-cysteine methyltransferase related protein
MKNDLSEQQFYIMSPIPSKKNKPKPTRQKLSAVKPSGKREESFFGLVYEVARQIPRGRVTSYGAIANCLGTKLSARMVGWAMNAAGRITPRVPAHRVVNRVGLLSGKHHFSPPDRMQELLEKEGIKVKDDQVVEFKKLFWDPAKEI